MYIKHARDIDCVVTLTTNKKLEIYEFCLRLRGVLLLVIT